MPLFHDLKLHHSVEKVLEGETGLLKRAVVNQVAVSLRQPGFVEFAELLRATGKTIERTAHALEGCPCHKDVWVKLRGVRGRKRKVVSSGQDTCAWKGRQGPWFVAEGRSQLYQDIQHATSARLTEWLGNLQEPGRANILAAQQQLRDALVETLQEKSISGITFHGAPLAFTGACLVEISASRSALRKRKNVWTNTTWRLLAGRLAQCTGWHMCYLAQGRNIARSSSISLRRT